MSQAKELFKKLKEDPGKFKLTEEQSKNYELLSELCQLCAIHYKEQVLKNTYAGVLDRTHPQNLMSYLNLSQGISIGLFNAGPSSIGVNIIGGKDSNELFAQILRDYIKNNYKDYDYDRYISIAKSEAMRLAEESFELFSLKSIKLTDGVVLRRNESATLNKMARTIIGLSLEINPQFNKQFEQAQQKYQI